MHVLTLDEGKTLSAGFVHHSWLPAHAAARPGGEDPTMKKQSDVQGSGWRIKGGQINDERTQTITTPP